MNTNVYNCSMIELDRRQTGKGSLTVIENSITIPFPVQRVYYLYDIPGGETRGGHAHKELYQLIIAASGSFDVVLYDGKIKQRFLLNRPNIGLLIVPGIWRELENFSSGSVCLVLASMKYDENDYIRDIKNYLQFKGWE